MTVLTKHAASMADVGPSSLHNLPAQIAAIFQQAQTSMANHRKNVVALHRLHVTSSGIFEETERGMRLTGEKAFNDAFIACVNRVLAIKRGVPNADRCVKFVAAYSVFAQERFRQDARAARNQGKDVKDEEEDDEEEDEDTPATRFVNILSRHFLRGFGAKNKNVRFRCCQATALLINGLESIDDELFEQIKLAFQPRLRDREAPVRVQAIMGIAKLQADEMDEDAREEDEPDYEDPDRQDVTSLMVRALRHDPSAEVRRAALFNVLPSHHTLPYILERLHDVDTINRRCVYLGTLSGAVLDRPECRVRPTPPEWSHVVKTGLGEREESVVRAVKKLMASWVDKDQANGTSAEHFLDRFDLLSAPDTAVMALKAAFEARPALLDTVQMDNDFWQDLTPGKAILARVFAEHCKTLGAQGEKRMEETMPLVTALAFRTQAAWGALLEQLEVAVADNNGTDGDDERADLADLIEESRLTVDSLLHVSMHLDYGDEIGRRKMFGLVRDMVSNALLPDTLIEPCLDVLRKLSAGQKDFVRIIVELVQEIDNVIEPTWGQEEDEDDDEAEIEQELMQEEDGSKRATKETPSPEQVEQQAVIDARRLSIIGGMLERIIVGGMQENTAMHGLVSQVIAPAVKSKDATVRERGLRCLGLCCLLDAKLALSTFALFLNQTSQSEGQIRQTSIQIVFDQLTTHGLAYLLQAQIQQGGGDQAAVDAVHNEIVGFLLSLLEDDDVRVQSIAAEGMAKLMLSGIIADDEALRSLILVYMSPETRENQGLRQCLSYFLPIYCLSSSTNQRRLQRVLINILDILTEVWDERESDNDMIEPLQVGRQLLDWCDPLKGVYANKDDVTIHLDLAIELVQCLFVKHDHDDYRKVVCQLLGKITLPDDEALSSGGVGGADETAIVASLLVLLGTLQPVCPLRDAVSRNNVSKFQLKVKRLYPAVWTRVQAMDLYEAPELDGVRAFMQAPELEQYRARLLKERGDDITEMLDKGDDGTVFASTGTSPRRSVVRRTLSASTSRSVSGATSRKASVGSVSGTGTATAARKRRGARTTNDSDDGLQTLEQSIVEEDEEASLDEGNADLDDFDSL